MSEPSIEQIKAQIPVSDVIAGLHTAMAVGAPANVADRATFFVPVDTPDTGFDDEGVPFDPTVRPEASYTKHTVPCAMEYLDGRELASNFGMVQASELVLTLLDPDYQRVKGFDFVVVAGQRYYYEKTENPVGLGNLTVWTVHTQAEDQK